MRLTLPREICSLRTRGPLPCAMSKMNRHAVAIEADIIKRAAEDVARAANAAAKLTGEARAFLQSKGFKA